MFSLPVIAVFDIGKTNKKFLVFNDDYKIVFEQTLRFREVMDDEGDPCEDLSNLRSFIFSNLQNVLQNREFNVKGINFSTYGASLVHLDKDGAVVTPLYSYSKNYPKDLQDHFYATYGGEQMFSIETASPALGFLNSGMQLYWLKHVKPKLFNRIRHSLHLPQYLNFLLTGEYLSELTSIGCHTNLWDFSKKQYHEWVFKEGVVELLPSIVSSSYFLPGIGQHRQCSVGVGLHDSSAALLPYLTTFKDPFVLISTGTWCISLNPFNSSHLTMEELNQDCLFYIAYNGKPVKASRLFAGNEHEHQVKRLAAYFNKDADYYKNVQMREELMRRSQNAAMANPEWRDATRSLKISFFPERDLSIFNTYEEAYHQLVADIVEQQVHFTRLVLDSAPIKKLFVDGGFSNNSIYMNLLAESFPELEVYASIVPQASALGAALAIHEAWNDKCPPRNLIQTKRYKPEMAMHHKYDPNRRNKGNE